MLKITVTGTMNSGRTTVAQIIEDALLRAGITGVVNADPDRTNERAARPDEFVAACARAVQRKQELNGQRIVIETVQVPFRGEAG